jgi:hypothetical protein
MVKIARMRGDCMVEFCSENETEKRRSASASGAGGVATSELALGDPGIRQMLHTFNNLLAIASLNLEVSLETVPETSELHERLTAALIAVLKGSDLSTRMLQERRRC